MLVAVQKSMFETFPLSEHLVEVKPGVRAPEFLGLQPLMDLESLQMHPVGLPLAGVAQDLSSINVLVNFPGVTDGFLDKSQLEAVKRILTKKVAIVQGPPGTGKTFVSITALVVMLRNWHIGDPPIIVSAQTNHALDQLLTKVAFFDKSILRLGGRAKEDDELIQSLTLYPKRKEARRFLSGLDHARQLAADKLKRLGDVMVADIDEMNLQPRNEAETFFELGLITKEQYHSISDDRWIRSKEDVSDSSPGSDLIMARQGSASG